jgi:regulator of sirC expression with transglutaminase-like and TPR domain
MLNVVPEAKYQHPSDSYLDVVFARRGGPLASLGLMLRYVVGRERGSPLYD